MMWIENLGLLIILAAALMMKPQYFNDIFSKLETDLQTISERNPQWHQTPIFPGFTTSTHQR